MFWKAVTQNKFTRSSGGERRYGYMKKIIYYYFLVCLFITCGRCFSITPDLSQGFINNGDIKIHYISKGRSLASSPSLLFIPGLSMPAWIFDKQLQYFSQWYSVVAMDPRSQGDSTQTSEGHHAAQRARDIKAVVDELQLKPVVLIGWSLAVSEVISYLDQFGSDGVAGIVLIDGLAGFDLNNKLVREGITYWFEFQKERHKNTDEFVRGMFRQPQEKEYLENLVEASLRMPTNTFMTLVYNMIVLDFRPVLPSLKVPTLICSVNGSWRENFLEVKNLIPGARLEFFQDAGHALFVDQPEKFNRVLEGFLKFSG